MKNGINDSKYKKFISRLDIKIDFFYFEKKTILRFFFLRLFLIKEEIKIILERLNLAVF